MLSNMLKEQVLLLGFNEHAFTYLDAGSIALHPRLLIRNTLSLDNLLSLFDSLVEGKSLFQQIQSQMAIWP